MFLLVGTAEVEVSRAIEANGLLIFHLCSALLNLSFYLVYPPIPALL